MLPKNARDLIQTATINKTLCGDGQCQDTDKVMELLTTSKTQIHGADMEMITILLLNAQLAYAQTSTVTHVPLLLSIDDYINSH